jgi:prolyl-tRNA synthetase
MRLSRSFIPTMKETPAEAQIASHRLMLRAGLVRQTSAGIYAWLPLGYRVLRNIERIVREEQNAAGAQEVLMPTIQSAELWRESGRYDDYGKEMLRIQDRHERDMLYGPTNEEVITDLFRQSVHSYRELPQILYHIQWKFRDEVRPRFGLMRGREFLMKDAYSFDVDQAGARHSYNKMFVAYLRTFARLGLKSIPMRAESGPIGGDMSHEFIILASTGESEVFCHKDYLDLPVPGADVNFDDIAGLQSTVDKWTSNYAATSDMHDAAAFGQIPADKQVSARGIEVGHIFYFGTKYSEPMKAVVSGPDGVEKPVHMGSYGIGPSRLVAAIIEAFRRAEGSFKQIFDGDRSYSSMPGIGLPPASHFGLPVLAKFDQPGYTVSALPDKKKLRGFRVADAEGNTTDFYIDPATGRVVSYVIPYNGYTFGTENSKMKEVDGILVPFNFSQRLESQMGAFFAEYKVKDVKINGPIADDVFVIPN